MSGKLLQALGALFVLGLVGGAVGGLMVLKDRIKVVVAADDAGATGPDPIALLRDDVRQVASDAAEWQQGVGRNFEQLGTALEERATARHEDVQRLRTEVAALREVLAALRREHAATKALVAALPAAVAAATPAVVSPAVVSPAVASPAVVATAPVAPSEPIAAATEPPAAAPPEPVAAPEANAAPAKPKGGFLTFSVPTSKFRFDEPQDYALVPDLCSVGFDAKSTLHDFTGRTGAVRGGFRADFDEAEAKWSGEIVCQAATLVTGVEGRDDNMRDHLDTKSHAEIRFRLDQFKAAPDGLDEANQKVRGEVSGTMTIRGQSKPFAMPVAVEVDAQKRVVVTGQAPLKLSDYGVPVPSQLGLINMQDEVVVWIALRARAAAGGKKQ
jgi:polyisoprenoid-binding protein YceI/BMFP domain-containing protein YqiC